MQRTPHAARGQRVDVGGRDIFAPVDADVRVAEVVGQDDEDVGVLGGGERLRGEKEEGE